MFFKLYYNKKIWRSELLKLFSNSPHLFFYLVWVSSVKNLWLFTMIGLSDFTAPQSSVLTSVSWLILDWIFQRRGGELSHSNNEEISAGGPGPAQLQPPGARWGGRGGGGKWGGVGGQLYIQVCHWVLLRMTFEQGTSVLPTIQSFNTFFQLPEVKNFIYSDFESKFDRTVFKKIPGKAPEAIFYTQSGKEVERLNIEKFDR